MTAGLVEATLAAQGIALAAGRAERLARGLAPTIAAVTADTCALAFDLEPPAFLTVLNAQVTST